MKIIPKEVKTSDLHAYMLGAVSPRPICFASTIDNNGNPNLAPFSFFNAFGSNPPLLIFSPARRVRNNTIKHTVENVYENMEVVINVVSYNMVQQMSLASCEYAKGINEFEKAGFTPVKSDIVKPFRVLESPVSIECKVTKVIETGLEGGAANLIFCEILCMHINDDILDSNLKIDPHKIDLVARMGGDYYCRASGDAVFKVPKPNTNLGIGIDALPQTIRLSKILNGNDLGILGNFTEIPIVSTIQQDTRLEQILSDFTEQEQRLKALHVYAKELIEKNELERAWQILLI